MKTITTSDTIFATIRRGFRVIATFTVSGMSSIADVLAMAQRQAGSGLATVTLRNSSAGWTDTRAILFR